MDSQNRGYGFELVMVLVSICWFCTLCRSPLLGSKMSVHTLFWLPIISILSQMDKRELSITIPMLLWLQKIY